MRVLACLMRNNDKMLVVVRWDTGSLLIELMVQQSPACESQ